MRKVSCSVNVLNMTWCFSNKLIVLGDLQTVRGRAESDDGKYFHTSLNGIS